MTCQLRSEMNPRGARARVRAAAPGRRSGSLPLAVTGLALVAALASACGRGDAPVSAAPLPAKPAGSLNLVRIPPDSPQLKEIRVEPVRLTQAPSDEFVAPARVAIDPNRISRVLPPVGGRVLKVLVKFGDLVEQGQPLVIMDSADADAAVAADLQAYSTERQTKAALQKAETDFRRAKDLYDHQAIAEKDLLQAQNDLASATSGYEVAQAGLEQARRKLEVLGLKRAAFHQPFPVPAPINGRVLEVNVAPGEYRAAISFHTDTTAPLMSIADLSTVWISADVPEPLVQLVHVGDVVAISLVSFPSETFSGRVARIGDVLDGQTRALKVQVQLPNPQGRLRPEMYGTIRFVGATRPTLLVPSAALVREYGLSVLFVEKQPGEFERRRVVPGLRVGDRVVIVSGLETDERIIVDGAMLLKGQ